jgi:hypothetical protein
MGETAKPADGTIGRVQTRYLILASLLAGLVILVAAAIWFSGL